MMPLALTMVAGPRHCLLAWGRGRKEGEYKVFETKYQTVKNK